MSKVRSVSRLLCVWRWNLDVNWDCGGDREGVGWFSNNSFHEGMGGTGFKMGFNDSSNLKQQICYRAQTIRILKSQMGQRGLEHRLAVGWGWQGHSCNSWVISGHFSNYWIINKWFLNMGLCRPWTWTGELILQGDLSRDCGCFENSVGPPGTLRVQVKQKGWVEK